ncbi:hypothetical protein Mal48_17720 [Thalassoglobus polymorphus]|uniref:Uncharacterized protein n=1 Tax=Thalassoglobus polymorphus TaxID=2527994 RepID=A0A517QLL8_9PLAN|nr:hypothetical protein Mal48_17720 [Thalassoglobus polymorphus]
MFRNLGSECLELYSQAGHSVFRETILCVHPVGGDEECSGIVPTLIRVFRSQFEGFGGERTLRGPPMSSCDPNLVRKNKFRANN